MELIDAAPRTFFGVPGARDLAALDAQVAFLGVPYDGGMPQPGIATGQRGGPAAARAASVVGTVSALGIRNVGRAEIDGLRELGGRWATTRDVLERGPADVVHETVRDAAALYVSIDLDVLDASVAPGHSLPEPGGLGYRELRALLAEVAGRGRVIGFDVVELNPALDPSGVTARLAAWTITHLLSEIFDQRR